MYEVVIVGGGIAGLAAALRIERAAADARVTVLEAGSRLGGKIVTAREQGYIVEGGPDSFLTSKPRGLGLCRELGIESRLIGTNEAKRRTFVMRAGRLHPMPEGLSGLVPARLEPLLASDIFSPEGKVRLRHEPDVPPRESDGDETLGSFMRRRFGAEAYERLIEPLMAGIYAGNGDELSLNATFPQLRALERAHGSVIRGIQAADARRAAGSPFVSFPIGMSELVEAITARFRRVRTLLRAEVRSIRRRGADVEVTHADGAVRAQSVILATPAFESARLLEHVAPDAAAALAEISYASTATVSLAYSAVVLPRPLDGFGYVIPRAEGHAALACTWTSSKFPSRAPAGSALLRVFLGRAGRDEITAADDEELLALARRELCDTLGIATKPLLTWLDRWPRGMPQYTLGHLERLQRIESALPETSGIHLAGALRGVGIPDCIASGESAGDAILQRNIRPTS